MRFTLRLTTADPAHYLPLARAAEAHAFDSISISESVFYPEQVSVVYQNSASGQRWWGPETPWVDPWVVIPAMAAVTERIHFYTAVMKFPLRNPILVAKTVGSAAVLSNNRVGLGVGLSWIPEEFTWTKTDWKARGALVNEGIEIVRLILAGGMVEYHGKHFDFGRLQISPAPSKPVPIYVGGWSDAAYCRAARLSDGLLYRNSIGERPIEEVILRINELRARYGRLQQPFRFMIVHPDALNLDSYKRLSDLGVTDFSAAPWDVYKREGPTLQDKLDSLERFASEVLAKLR